MATTWRNLAEDLGIPERSLRRHRARPDWPASVPRDDAGTVTDDHMAALRAWLGTLQRDRSGRGTHPVERAGLADQQLPAAGDDEPRPFDPRDAASVELALKRERMLHERLKRQILDGEHVPRDLLEGALAGLARTFADLLDELELSLPSRLANLPAGRIETELIRILDSGRQRLADRTEVELIRLKDLTTKRRKHRRGRGRPAAGAAS